MPTLAIRSEYKYDLDIVKTMHMLDGEFECDLRCKLYDENQYGYPKEQREIDSYNPIAFNKFLNEEIMGIRLD